MNTTAKGDSLENDVYEYFAELIATNQFDVKKELCKIYKKKGYYSKDRQKNIIFDVSIEVVSPETNEYSFVYLIECKNYKHKVGVDDIEEFFAKTQQIAPSANKAIVISNNAFQEGAFNFAKSKRIGLVRYVSRTNLDWALRRSPSSLISFSFALNEWLIAREGLHKEEIANSYLDFFGYINGTYTNSIYSFLSELSKQDKPVIGDYLNVNLQKKNSKWNVSYINEVSIKNIADNLHKQIKYSQGSVSLENICSYLEKQDGLEVIESDDLKKGVLGEISFSPLKIIIKKTHEDKNRKKFTLAHEIAHFLLGHSRYMDGEQCREANLSVEEPIKLGIQDIMRMEWQANYLASCLLLPEQELFRKFFSIVDEMGLSNRGFGALYVDGQTCNLNSFYRVTKILASNFEVSKAVVEVRLRKLKLVKGPGVGKLEKCIQRSMRFPYKIA